MFHYIMVVYRLCQCSLFKQFTTVFVESSSESCCLSIMSMFSFQAIHNASVEDYQCCQVVYRLCQCSLFKQFTTQKELYQARNMLFIDYVNVLFSSNSQPFSASSARCSGCLSIMSMFSFQAIHNYETPTPNLRRVVYRLCQCSLFKQFTTERYRKRQGVRLFIDYVNVLFSSNSQL